MWVRSAARRERGRDRGLGARASTDCGWKGAARHTNRRALRAWSLLELRCYLRYNKRLKLSVRPLSVGRGRRRPQLRRGPAGRQKVKAAAVCLRLGPPHGRTSLTVRRGRAAT